MTDFDVYFPHFDTNNNSTAANNGTNNNFTSSNCQNVPNDDKAMLQLNNDTYGSIDYNNQNLCEFQNETTNCYYNQQYRMQTDDQSPPKRETIHSGHFMVSEIDKDNDGDDEANVEEEIIKDEKKSNKIDQQVVIKTIDQSIEQFNDYYNGRKQRNCNIKHPKLFLVGTQLSSLFKKMNLGDDSKLTSPKWKQFKGFKISLQEKIRVNNLIWRAWHIKYVLGANPKFNPFPTTQYDTNQLETNHIYIVHRPEVMKMGKIFGINKDRNNFIACEYGKWRKYFKEIIIKKQRNKMNSMDQYNLFDTFGNTLYDSSNDQFNMNMFNPMSNYSSMHAELMQPLFSFGLQPEFMDTFDEPCLQSFLTQKNSLLPTLIEEEAIQESPKIQDIQSQQTIYSSNNNAMGAEIDTNYADQQQMLQVNNQLNNQMNNLQQQTNTQSQQQIQETSNVNYNFMNQQYAQQQQTIIQNNQSNQMSYRQNYLSNNGLMVEQQNVSNLNNQSSLNSNLTNNIMLPIEQQNQLSNTNINNNSQVNNGQFVIPKSNKSNKIRSRSVSSLPQQQQIQLQRHHMIENSSSLMEINNQPMLSNQSTFHNTTSNLLSTQQQQQNDNLQNQINLSNQQNGLSGPNNLSNIRSNNFIQRRSTIGDQQDTITNQQQQIMQQQQQHNSNQLNNSLQLTNNNSNYYNMNLNEVNNMNSMNNQNTQQTNTLAIDYDNRSTMRSTATNISTSYYNQSQMNNGYQSSIQVNQNLNNVLRDSSNYNLNSKYQSSNNEHNSGTILISQLLSTNSKLAPNFINDQSNSTFKRNSTGTYPTFQQYGPQDQFNNTISSSSVTNLVNSTNVNTSQSSLNTTNDLSNYSNAATNQLVRKSSNLSLHSNQSFSSFNKNNNSNLNQQQQVLNQSLHTNDLLHQSTKHNSTNLNNSLENLNNKNLLGNKSSHRIKREHHRKLSTCKLRNPISSNLTRSNSNKSINSPVSPTTSIQSTLLNQSNSTKQQINAASMTNDFLNFDRSSNLLMNNTCTNNNNLNSNLNANSSSLSSTPTLQSPLANSPFTSNQNDYSNDSIGIYNSSSFAFTNQNLNNGQQLNKLAIKSASQSPSTASSTSSTNNLPLSPFNSNLIKPERDQYREHRRVCHINAEQKRRCNIKHGFDTLRNILPSISTNNSTKISKAAMLQKGADHIRDLKVLQKSQKEAIEDFRAQIENLNQTIGIFQNQLPATGAPISGGMRPGQIKERFEDYVRERTQQNWKFYMFSIIMEPLLDSYNNTIPTTNFDELTSSVLRWLDQSCNLINLRREVLNSLRIISTSTNVLSEPGLLASESLSKVAKKHSNNNKKK